MANARYEDLLAQINETDYSGGSLDQLRDDLTALVEQLRQQLLATLGLHDVHHALARGAYPACAMQGCNGLPNGPCKAAYLAGQSSDRGVTVTWILVCEDCAEFWNEGGDWPAPLIPLGKPFVPDGWRP